MHPLTASELLMVWEEGSRRPLFERALLLLNAACPDEAPDALAKISIARRDASLLTLREWTFGPRLIGVTACPACGDRIEMNINVAEIRAAVPESYGDEFLLKLEDYQVDFRLPNTIDLREANSSGNREGMRTALIRRCILKARCNDEEVATEQLPAPVVEAVTARMSELDPQADTHLALTCPGCSHRWYALFDIVSFFWSEIQAWALRILREIHILASAYGWREADILAMSPMRRQAYLSMVGA